MSSNKKYWKSVEELDKIVLLLRRLEITNLLKKFLLMNFRKCDALSSSSTSRRDFLKYVGFSTAATLAACEGPVNKSIPYVLQPEQIIPGVADYYATSVFDGFDFANLWLKRVKGVLLKLIIQLLELSLVQMQEFMLRYFHCMTTCVKEPKIEGKNSTVDAKIKLVFLMLLKVVKLFFDKYVKSVN
jgi:molybdopterin-containing oxidoreductase family iron-sulfur binding subunit